MTGNNINDNVTYTCETNYRIKGTLSNKENATCGYNENLEVIWLNVPKCEGIYYVNVLYSYKQKYISF